MYYSYDSVCASACVPCPRADLTPFPGTEFHDYHHYAFNVNFASRLTVIDKVFGTYKLAKHRTEMLSEPKDPTE